MIVYNSGDGQSALCISISGRQTQWSYAVTPDKYFETNAHKPTGAYARSLGEGVNRMQRGHLVYQNMGHTALFVRLNGIRHEPVVGFFPKEGMLGSLSLGGIQAHGGAAVEGAWHDDAWMFNDQAALSFEIPVSLTAANRIRSMCLEPKLRSPDTRFQYQTMQDPGDDQSAARNCVAACMLNLEEIWAFHMMSGESIDTTARQEVKRVAGQMKHLLAQRGYMQGQMQQLVQTGFTHLPTGG